MSGHLLSSFRPLRIVSAAERHKRAFGLLWRTLSTNLRWLQPFLNNQNSVRTENVTSRHTHTSASMPNEQCPMEFSQIPGPRALPIIGNLWRYLPLIGEYRLDRMDANGRLNLARYGKIVREQISAEHCILHLFDPVHIEQMFKQEDRFPHRRSHRALLKFRRERPHLYRSGGIFPENGAEWARLRDIFKRHFLLTRNIHLYDEVLDGVANDTVRLIRAKRHSQTGELDEFQNEMYKWSLESICAILLDSRIGCLEPELAPNSDAARLIDAGHNTIDMVAQTEMYSGWEKRPNRAYRSLESSQDTMSEIVEKHFRNRIRIVERHPLTCPQEGSGGVTMNESLLTQFIRNSQIDRRDLFGMLVDGVMAGIDTTSITASFVLYFLAKHPKYQETLRHEIQTVLGNDRVLKAEHLTSMPWLKATVKETLRLRPVSIGVGRLTSRECTIGGYRIPTNTMIITQNQVSCQLDEYFHSAHRFMPERWFGDETGKRRLASGGSASSSAATAAGRRFLWLPFGHGTRMCLGRRIAELELYVLVAKLVTHFHIHDCPGTETINVRTKLINVPDKPMRFRFSDIERANGCFA